MEAYQSLCMWINVHVRPSMRSEVGVAGATGACGTREVTGDEVRARDIFDGANAESSQLPREPTGLQLSAERLAGERHEGGEHLVSGTLLPADERGHIVEDDVSTALESPDEGEC